MSAPRIVRTFTADVVEYVADGFNFGGCDNQSDAHCACSTWSETLCTVCDQEIVDGQRIQSISYPGIPYFDVNSQDQHWEHEYWHVECPEPELED